MDHNTQGQWEKLQQIWEIIDQLRGENGCPWDRKQSPESVQTYLVEESHEAASAIRAGHVQEAAEELGDLLFMVFFLIHLYAERGHFGVADVSDLICTKMIRRHPHVFGDVTVESTQEVRENWEKIKAEEKAAGKIPESLPALMRAHRMISRLSNGEGSGWNDLSDRMQEFVSRTRGLSDQMTKGEPIPSASFGEVLLDLVNLARLKGYRAEDCLHERLQSLDSPS